MKKQFIPIIFVLSTILLVSQGVDRSNSSLAIGQEDLRIQELGDGGFHLFIRTKPGLKSVLITESTRDPQMREPNYAFRAPAWNPINGDEIRILDENPIPKSAGIWSLISSTPKPHPELGEAFHIFIPYILQYGFPHTRNGEVYITDGTYLNIRAFTLPHADYRGNFRDNPFLVALSEQQPLPNLPSGTYMAETVTAFTEIASWSDDLPLFVREPDDTVNQVRTILEREQGRSIDIVICLDTTGSMRKFMPGIKQDLVPMLRQVLGHTPARIGIVRFKDYFDEYVTRVIPFTTDLDQVQRSINAINPRGGGDIPEAVHEALYDGATKFNWTADARLMILIGDAPPHLRPRGRITANMVQRVINEQDILVHAIILPQ